MAHVPTSWRTYLSKIGKPPFDTEGTSRQFALLSRFAARFRIASSVRQLEIDGVSQGTTDAYFAALRITLAYSALEALETALQAKGSVRIVDTRIAEALRSNGFAKLRTSLLESVSSSSGRELRVLLTQFFEGGSDDLRPAVYALRNLMCHGTLTAQRLDLSSSKARRNVLHQIADVVLHATDARFSGFVLRGKWK